MDRPANIDLVWSPEYELGHARIDSQHRQLFELYARAVAAFENCRGDEQVHGAVSDLISYTRFHFHDEESLMARLGYPALAAHRRKHQRLLAQVDTFAEELQDGKPVLIYEILGFVREWIHTHILEEDLKLRQSLKEWD